MKRKHSMTDAFLKEVKTFKADFLKNFVVMKKFVTTLDKKIKEVERREWSSGYCKGRRVENPKWKEKNKGKRSGSTTTIKQTLYEKQKGICNGCKIHLGIRHFHKDHIIPKAKGGKDTEDNLQLLCGACNTLKGKGSMGDLHAELKRQGLIKKRKKDSFTSPFTTQRTIWRKYLKKDYFATLLPSGEVKYDAKIFPSPFACAKYITKGKGVTGLRFWSIKDDNGHWIKLSDLPLKD